MKRKDTLKARGIHRHKQMVTVLGMKYKDRNDMNHNHSRKDSLWKRIKGIYWLKYTVAAVWAAFVFLPDAGIAYGAAKAGGEPGAHRRQEKNRCRECLPIQKKRRNTASIIGASGRWNTRAILRIAVFA